jgi:hypothetical protein
MAAATVYISESNGAGEVVTDNITNINFGSVDQPNIVAANHPIIQTEISYFKMLRFKVQSLGTSTTIKDLRAWKSAGAYAANDEITAQMQAAGFAYVQPTPAAPNPPFNAPAAIITADPGGPTISIGHDLTGTFKAAGGTVGVPGYSDYFALTYKTNAAPVGPVSTKTLTFQFDES